jgi:hypothetical protein
MMTIMVFFNRHECTAAEKKNQLLLAEQKPYFGGGGLAQSQNPRHYRQNPVIEA